MHFKNTGDKMMKTERQTFTPEFRLEAAQLVVDQNYKIKAAADAIGIGKSTMDKWVRQLRIERVTTNAKMSHFTG